MTERDREFRRGEIDGRKDGAAGAKPLSGELLKRFYPTSYREGYRVGYEKACGVFTAAKEA